jgi:hypothetical protein
MAGTGATCSSILDTQHSALHMHANPTIAQKIVLSVVGWGDTATMIVLSHALYIDTLVWIVLNDDVSLPKLPQKFNPYDSEEVRRVELGSYISDISRTTLSCTSLEQRGRKCSLDLLLMRSTI